MERGASIIQKIKDVLNCHSRPSFLTQDFGWVIIQAINKNGRIAMTNLYLGCDFRRFELRNLNF